MEFRVLGPLEVFERGLPVALGGPKQRAVLAHLLLRANEVVPIDRLIEEIWGEEPPESARNALQSYVSRLRHALGQGARIDRRPPGYALRVDPEQVDALRFERLLREARRTLADDPQEAVETLQEALSLWGGSALSGLGDEISLRSEAARLDELRLAAIEDRIAAELALGREAEVVTELEALVEQYPLRERLWGHLMLALYRTARQADALAAFQRARGLLADEFGLEPSPGLRRLQGQVLRQDPGLELGVGKLRGYKLIEQIGEGSFGVVYRAAQPHVGREVAVKVIRRTLANDPRFIRRFDAEAHLVARLEHPHIVPLYDYWREPEAAYLVMRWLRGGSLKRALADGPLEFDRAGRMLDQIASGLAAAHRERVVHRDVKPANILLDEDGNAYLSDFGIATEVAAERVEPTAPGTTAYLSPEQIRGEPSTQRTDIYSLGVVLYEALAGQPPFTGATPRELANRHLTEPLPPLRAGAASAAIDEVIERATAKDPAERYPDAPTLAAAFQEAVGIPPAARAPPAREIRDPHKGLPPFVGRENELAEFLEGLEGALSGRTSVFLIAGPPGIGKSRLADEVAARAGARGARVLWGRCWEAGGAPAYWPWVQALRTYIRGSDRERVLSQLGGGATDVAQMLPELHELLPDLPALPSLDPEGARFRLFDSTASFLRAAAEVQPLVIVLDDLHAADAPSLLLLRFVARELGESRIVLVGAYRDSEAVPNDPLAEAVTELRREPITRATPLGGLAPSDVARLIELIAGVRPSEELALAIHAETEGNPLFVGELVRLLASEERLDELPGSVWRPGIPRGVRDVIGQRLSHLSDDCKGLLSVASVLGREFRLDALERVSERSGEELLDLLDEALAARVVTDPPAGRAGLRFSHALVRDSLYGDLGRKERLRLHRRTAATLEALYGRDHMPHLAELAHHFLEAAPGGDVDKAIDYARRAGEHAAVLLAYEEAARLYEMALEALELKTPPDESTRCELLLSLGDVQARGGDLPSSKETFVQAADLARALMAPRQLARAALGYGGKFVWLRAGKDRRLIPLLETALTALPAGDSALRARLLARLSGALRDHPVAERRASLSKEAVEIARRLGDRATLAYTLDGTYAALSWPRDTQAWLAMARELTHLADATGDKEQAYFGHLHAFGAFVLRGDIREADAELAAMAALAQELRQPPQAWWLSVARGTRALLAGRIGEAEQLMQQLADLDSTGHVLDATFDYAMTLQAWAVRREQGRLAEVEGSLESAGEEYPTMFLLRCVLASLYSELGRTVQAQEELARLAADDFAELRVGTDWFFGAGLLAGVCAFLGDASRAAPLYEALLPYADMNVLSHPEVCLGSASRYLGLLASTMSLREESARHFERALEMNARMGAQPWVAHTQDDYARMLLAGDRPGDTQRALELIGQALATYRQLGMEGWAEKASVFEQALRVAQAPG